MHAKGMVHRDLTPGNVLVADDGTAKLVDLGIAMWSDVTLTGEEQNAGTPGYMAPEVTRGNVATPAADMYSLGMLLAAAVGRVEPISPGSDPSPGGAESSLSGVLSALLDPNPAARPSAERARGLLLAVASGTKRPRRRIPLSVLAAGAMLVTAAIASFLLLKSSGELSGQASGQKTGSRPGPLSGPEFVGDPRTADVCELVDENALEHFGPVKVDSDYGEFNRCALLVAMGGDEANVVDVSIWLETGPEPETAADPQRVQGNRTIMDRREQTGDYCKLYIHLPERYRVGVTARHLDNRGANVCPMAEVLAEEVYDTLGKGELPRRSRPAPESLASVDACALLDSGDLAGPLGSRGVRPRAGFANWSCMWIAHGGSRHVLVSFDRGNDPLSAEDGTLVRFAGRDGFVAAEGWGATKCLAGVAFRSYVSVDQQEPKLEEVFVFVRSDQPSKQRCASASALATSVAERLPG